MIEKPDNRVSRHPHILNAASNLLGIALVIIVALHATGVAAHSMADEVGWVAVLLLYSSCAASYLAMRHSERQDRLETWADRFFLGGLAALFASVLVLAFYR